MDNFATIAYRLELDLFAAINFLSAIFKTKKGRHMDRLTQLEDAHRALAAQHTALMEFVRAILPLIPLPAEALQQALVEVYDYSNMHMDAAAMDAEYQAEVRRWLEILSRAAKVGCEYPEQRGDSG